MITITIGCLSMQKYRLHTRRLPSTPATGAADRSPVVLGDLWTSQDGCGESSKVSSSQSASPQGPFQLAGNGGYSTTGGDSMEDEEDTKSESYEYLKTEAHTSKRWCIKYNNTLKFINHRRIVVHKVHKRGEKKMERLWIIFAELVLFFF